MPVSATVVKTGPDTEGHPQLHSGSEARHSGVPWSLEAPQPLLGFLVPNPVS